MRETCRNGERKPNKFATIHLFVSAERPVVSGSGELEGSVCSSHCPRDKLFPDSPPLLRVDPGLDPANKEDLEPVWNHSGPGHDHNWGFPQYKSVKWSVLHLTTHLKNAASCHTITVEAHSRAHTRGNPACSREVGTI